MDSAEKRKGVETVTNAVGLWRMAANRNRFRKKATSGSTGLCCNDKKV